MQLLSRYAGRLVRYNGEFCRKFGISRRDAAELFCVSAGAVWQKNAGRPLRKGASYQPVLPQDFDEGRVFRVSVPGFPLIEAKGCGRVTRAGLEPVDAYGPYETGPPGGLWLEFALKEYDRGLRAFNAGVRACSVPLCVVTLPFYLGIKRGPRVERRQLAVGGRLLLQPVRIEELCWLLQQHEPALQLLNHHGFDSLDSYLESFANLFGENLRALFDARLAHFALWGGGDVGLLGELADFDSIHDLNPQDLADCVDGAFSTLKRLLGAAGSRGSKPWNNLADALTGKRFSAKNKKKLYSLVVKELLRQHFKAARPARGLLVPKFDLPEHKAYYYSTLAIK